MADQYWNNVVLALPLNGDAGSTTFTDLKGHTVSRAGHTVIATTPSGPAAYFDGAGDRLYSTSTDYALGTEDFTIEFFLRPTGTGSDNYARLIQIGNNAATGGFWLVRLATSSPMDFLMQGYSGGYINLAPAGISAGVVNDTRVHMAICRIAGVFTVYVAGVLKATGAGYPTYAITQSTVNIGSNTSNAESLQGYIDNVRITKGVARYTADFTTPTISYFADAIGYGSIKPITDQAIAAGTVPIVGWADFVPNVDTLAGNGRVEVIVGHCEASTPLETVASTGTSEAIQAVQAVSISPKLETIDGSGGTSIVCFGLVKPKRSQIAGDGLSNEWIGHGDVNPRIEIVTSAGTNSIIGRAEMSSRKKPAVSGEGATSVVGSAVIASRCAVVSSRGLHIPVGQGTLQGKTLRLSSTGTSSIKGSAIVSPPLSRIKASRHAKASLQSLAFGRVSIITGTVASPSIEPIHFTR